MKLNRRHFSQLLGASCSVGILPRIAGATIEGAAPHFFLFVWYGPGADATYLFDARKLALTQGGKIQNYLGEEPTPYIGVNGQTTLMTKLVDPLKPFLDRFSIINGVQMATGDDGHAQNISYLLTGNTLLSGPSLLAELRTGDASLDFLQVGTQFDIDRVTYTNAPAGIALGAEDARRLSDSLRSGGGDGSTSGRKAAADAFLIQRAEVNGLGTGLFSRGVRDLAAGFKGAGSLSQKLAGVALDPGITGSAAAVRLVHQYFQQGIAQSAMIVFGNEDFDSHSEDQAKRQPETFGALVQDLATIFEYLRSTPIDEARGLSLLDVTTVLCCSEFSRTMRQEGKAIDETGTDHNSLTNSMLIGGKGIKGGLVVGASDLTTVDAAGDFINVSPAHRLLDPTLKKPMGCPFDPMSMLLLDVKPEQFNASQYLSANMVVNTIHELFKTPADIRRRFVRTDPETSPIRGLLS